MLINELQILAPKHTGWRPHNVPLWMLESVQDADWSALIFFADEDMLHGGFDAGGMLLPNITGEIEEDDANEGDLRETAKVDGILLLLLWRIVPYLRLIELLLLRCCEGRLELLVGFELFADGLMILPIELLACTGA